MAHARSNVEFKTSDGVTLRGWFYPPSDPSQSKTTSTNGTSTTAKYPCLILSHGFSALKEMDLDAFAEYFTTHLPISCLVYDNRGFGDSDTGVNAPRLEIVPALQCSDISDAVSYACGRSDVDGKKVGIWGSSFSGGHVLYVGAVDRRIKVVLSQA
jgi:cephalosporin-C deacetylase-like acetyl esterase